jgi:hypothetical protein
MGDAIARFREAALATRRHEDEIFSRPDWAVEGCVAESFGRRCRRTMRAYEAGEIEPGLYVRELARAKRHAESQRNPGSDGQPHLNFTGWLPPSMRGAANVNIKRLAEQAAKDALDWGARFSIAESRVRALCRLTIALSGFLKEPAEYGKAISRWQEAFDALAPFVGEPPAAAASTSNEKTGSGRGRGGRPQNDEDLARSLLAGWEDFESEEGRKTKDRYLAQRPDVRVLKTEQARQAKIASLRTALDSALALRRSKARQKRKARG